MIRTATTALWLLAAISVSLLFAHYLVKGWNTYMHDSEQVERY